jgi:Uma2 family endonuclease
MVNPTITIPQTFKVSHEQFQQLAAVNRDLRLERTATGELIVMPPTGSNTGKRNIDVEGQLWLWNRQTKLGVVFDSSTGFHLPNGADRSPDASWVKLERWEALTPEEREGSEGDNPLKRLAELAFHPVESSKNSSLLTGLLRMNFSVILL